MPKIKRDKREQAEHIIVTTVAIILMTALAVLLFLKIISS